MSAAVLSFHVSENMECAQLSIKEETEDETKYWSYGLHHDIGVLGEDSSQVKVRQVRSTFRFLFFIVSFAISQSSCRSVRCLASCL
jgi:hypothetical protein